MAGLTLTLVETIYIDRKLSPPSQEFIFLRGRPHSKPSFFARIQRVKEPTNHFTPLPYRHAIHHTIGPLNSLPAGQLPDKMLGLHHEKLGRTDLPYLHNCDGWKEACICYLNLY